MQVRKIDLSIYYGNGINSKIQNVEASIGAMQKPAQIDVMFSEKEFRIIDNCGGISSDRRKTKFSVLVALVTAKGQA